MSGTSDYIDCPCCGNKILLTGLNRTLTGIEFYGGYCMKCGYVTYGDFVSSDQVNEWREKDPFYEDLKQIDELYLHTNRYKKVPFDQKMIELGLVTKEEIKVLDEGWKKIHGKKIEEMKKLENPNMSLYDWRRRLIPESVDRRYGLLKMNFEDYVDRFDDPMKLRNKEVS